MPVNNFDKQIARRCLLKSAKTTILPEQLMAIFQYVSGCRLLMTQAEALAQFEKQSQYPSLQMVEYVYDIFKGQIPSFELGTRPFLTASRNVIDPRLKLMLGCKIGLAHAPFRQVLLSVYVHVEPSWYASALVDFALSVDMQIDYLISILLSFETTNNDDRLRHFLSAHLHRQWVDKSDANEFYEVRVIQEEFKEKLQELQFEQLGRI